MSAESGPVSSMQMASTSRIGHSASSPVAHPEMSTGFARPVATLPDRALSLIQKGWQEAIVGAAISAGFVYAVGMALAVGLRMASDEVPEMADMNRFPVSQVAGALALMFTRVPVRFDGSLDFASPVFGEFTVTFALLGIFVVLGLLLRWAGFRTARAAGVTDPLGAALQGAKVGAPFGTLAFAAAMLFGLEGQQGVTVGASPGIALAWGVLVGVVLGAWGGIRTQGGLGVLGRGRTMSSRLWGGSTVAALWGIGVGVLLLSVLSIAAAVFGMIEVDGFAFLVDEGGDWAVIGGVVAFLLVLPNLAVDLFVFAHGGTIELPDFLDLSGETVALNYLSWPFGNVAEASVAPGWTFVLLLLPFLSVVLAGYWAVRLTGARTRAEARSAGLRVSIPYAIGVWALAVAARVKVEGVLAVDLDRFAGDAVLGASLAAAAVLSLLWGLVGGSLGSWLAAPRGAHSAPPQSEPSKHAPDERSMPCPSCGVQVNADKRFCTSCGNELTTRQQPAHSPAAEDEPWAEVGEFDHSEAPVVPEDGPAVGHVRDPSETDERVVQSADVSSVQTTPVSDADGGDRGARSCGHCGAQNPADFRFCSSCGRFFEETG